MTEQNIQPTPEQQPPHCCKPNTTGVASGKAISALVFGILSLICCGFFCGIPAIILGKQEMHLIKEGKSDAAGQSVAQIGFILGIVGTVISCLGFIIYGVIILLGILGVGAGIMQGIQESAFTL